MKAPCIHILFLTVAHNQASYRYRVEQFLPYWREYGIEATVMQVVGMAYPRKLFVALKSWKFDFVWLQKKTLAQWIIWVIARKTPIIYDFDDALYAPEPHGSSTPKPGRPGSAPVKRRLQYILARSHLVFAGSTVLYKYAEQFAQNVRLIPTSLDILPAKKKGAGPGPVVVGWIGNTQNLYYLQQPDRIFSQIQHELGDAVVFWCMSGLPPSGLATEWHFSEWSSENERSWLARLDIGIMPLSEDSWSSGKCAFKLLQYMAYECAVIGSAVGANFDVIQDGVNGFLVKTPEDWNRAIVELVYDSEKRTAMGRASRDSFEENFHRSRVQERIACSILSQAERA